MKNILLIDDDEKYLDSLENLLTIKNNVTKTTSAKEGINLCSKNTYDLIIIDLYMEELSGITLSEIIQELFPPQRIIILSGNATMQDQLDVLDRDVIDFIDKSTSAEILMKRIERILSDTSSEEKLFSKKENIVLNQNSKVAYINDEKVHLTNKEFKLLSYFLSNKNKILSREDMYEAIWGEMLYTTNLRIVDIHVLKLRHKLDLKCIYSERGVGYKWEE